MISEKTIQEVFTMAQVQDLIMEYVTLKKRGVNLIGLCPFHDEKTPSFTVSPSKNIYKCFGCGKGGGPVQFLMEHDSMSFPEAIRSLAGRYNIDIEEDSNQDKEEYEANRRQEESYFIINKFAADFYADQLKNTEDGRMIAMSYFKERGFLESTIEKFQLGYSPTGGKVLTDLAAEKQFNGEFMRDLGLTSQKGYDFFRSRVMFPIHAVSGKVIAFAGRTLSTQKSQPKYINSPETPIYNKRKVLYGMHLAKTSIRKKDNCLVVEGYTDVISLVQNGVENVVASSGTAFTTEQVRLIKRYTENVTFLYDGDAAGVKAALRGMDIVLENGMNVSLVMLPDGEDPDSYIRKSGNSAFEEYLADNAKDFIFFKMDLLMGEAGTDPIKKASMIKDIIGSVAKLRDPIKRSLYVSQCSQALNVDEAILVKEVNKQIRNEIKQKQLEQKREERLKQRAAMNKSQMQFDQPPTQWGPPPGQQQGPSPSQAGGSSSPFPNEPFPYEEPAGYHEMDEYPEERIKHRQPDFKLPTNDYQEKDLARIVISYGDQVITLDEEEEMTVADFIFTNINSVFEYFDNPLCKRVIEEGFKFADRQDKTLSISQFFINHSDQAISIFAIDRLSSPYEFADWERIGVYLNQKMPEKNFLEDSMQAVLRFKLKKISKVLDKIKERIAVDGTDDEGRVRLLKAFKKLQLEKKELAEQLGNVIS